MPSIINSVLNQTYNNYEVIVVDNNSTDSTKKIIEDFQSKDKRIRYIFEQERRRGAARNTGEKSAEGDIVFMTDSDCIVPTNWIANMINPLINNECDCVQGSQVSMTDDFWSKQMQMRYLKKGDTGILDNVDTKTFAIKMDVLKKIGFTNRAYYTGNDTELSIRLSKNNMKLRFLENVKVKHHHANSLTRVIKQQFSRAICCQMMTQEHKNYLKNTVFPQRTAQTLGAFFGFFPGLIGALKRQGIKWTYFEFVIGMAWRAGLVAGTIYNPNNSAQAGPGAI